MTDALSLPWAETIPDTNLLARYAAERDEAAFAVLVRRHGPLVLGVCLRNAGHRQDAEDAFQAVFLLLAKEAAGLRHPERLANWLYGVAVRVGRKARRSALRRRTHEAKAVPPPDPAASGWSDVAPVLDDELLRLAEHHREAVVLCDLQGLSRTEAAERLGIPEGTLSSRLNAARKKLAERLAKRGVTLSVGVLAAHATAAVSEELAVKVSKALTAFHADGALPAPLAGLISEGVLSMRTKLLALVAVVGLGSVGVLAGWPADEPKPQPAANAKADPPKGAGPKGDEPPKEDFGRPPRERRAKLIDKHTAGVRLSDPVWSADGKRLYVTANPTVAWSGHEFAEAGVTMTTPPNHSSYLGLTNGNKEYVAFSAGGGVNAVNEAVGLDVREFLEFDGRKTPAVNAKRVWSVEIDAEDGRPVAITSDRKRIFSKLDDPTNGPVKAWFRVLDGKTGEPLRELVKPGDGETLAGWKFSATADRLFLAVNTAKGPRLRAIDTMTGKSVWDREIDFAAVVRPDPPKGGTRPVVPGLDEKAAKWQLPIRATLAVSSRWVGVNAIQNDPSNARSVPGMVCVLVDAATGKDGPPLGDLGSGDNGIGSISADGKLIAGGTESLEPDNQPPGGFGGGGPGGRSVRSRRQLVVWSGETGKVLKVWPTDHSVTVAFSPTAPLLAVFDTKATRTRTDANNFTTTYQTTLGFWDLSGLLK